jgi:putative redox protein
MAGQVKVQWRRAGLQFEGTSDRGRVALASSLDAPGLGCTPMELLLASVGGCTGIDVASILLKMRQPLEDFWLEITGKEAEDHPQKFTTIAVVYHLKGDLDEAKVVRAIGLSEAKYCSVEATLRPGVSITSRYVIERQEPLTA